MTIKTQESEEKVKEEYLKLVEDMLKAFAAKTKLDKIKAYCEERIKYYNDLYTEQQTKRDYDFEDSDFEECLRKVEAYKEILDLIDKE